MEKLATASSFLAVSAWAAGEVAAIRNAISRNVTLCMESPLCCSVPVRSDPCCYETPPPQNHGHQIKNSRRKNDRRSRGNAEVIGKKQARNARQGADADRSRAHGPDPCQ